MEQTRLHCGMLPAPRAPLAMPGLASLQLRIFTCWSHEAALPARLCWHHICYKPRSSALGQKRARASAESKAGHITQPSFSQKPHSETESFPPTSLQMGLDGGRTCPQDHLCPTRSQLRKCSQVAQRCWVWAQLSTHLMMSVYSRSFPLLSFHLRYITEASTLAGENVLGSFSSEITLRRMVLAISKHKLVRAEVGQQPPTSQECQQPQCHSVAASCGSGGEPGAGPPVRVYLSKVEQVRQETAMHGLSGSRTFPCKL